MKTPSKAQLTAILGAIALLVLLLFARKTGAPESTKKSESPQHGDFSIDAYIDSIKITLPEATKAELAKLETLKNGNDSLSQFWLRNSQPGIAASYLKKGATEIPTFTSWNKTGEFFYKAARFAKDEAKHYFIDNAIESYNKALELDSTNLDTKVNLGICYVESSGEPMKGIMLLREVVLKDSTHINAQLNLGLFAVQSGQYDKAIERFERILRINPEFTEAYLYLGQTYASMGKKDKAIDALEKFKKLSNDAAISAEVTEYINQLKNS